MRRPLLLALALLTVTAFGDEAANEARFVSDARQLIFEGTTTDAQASAIVQAAYLGADVEVG